MAEFHPDVSLDPAVTAFLGRRSEGPSDDLLARPWESAMRTRELRAALDRDDIEAAELPFTGRIDDLVIPTRDGILLDARRYVPEGITGSSPAAVYFHGGGFVSGSLDTHDNPVRAMAAAARVVVISVGYRLAPEASFPTPVHDAVDSLAWVAEHAAELGIDPQRLAVAGDSAGANLAVAALLMIRDAGGPRIRYQLLFYPVLDLVVDYRSKRVGYVDGFDPEVADAFMAAYAPTAGERAHPLASPLRAGDLSRLPEMLMVTAGGDPFRPEGEQFARLAAAQGTAVATIRGVGLAHGFLGQYGVVSASTRVSDLAFGELSRVLRQH